MGMLIAGNVLIFLIVLTREIWIAPQVIFAKQSFNCSAGPASAIMVMFCDSYGDYADTAEILLSEMIRISELAADEKILFLKQLWQAWFVSQATALFCFLALMLIRSFKGEGLHVRAFEQNLAPNLWPHYRSIRHAAHLFRGGGLWRPSRFPSWIFLFKKAIYYMLLPEWWFLLQRLFSIVSNRKGLKNK